MPMLLRKAFAKNSLKKTFVWNVSFHSQFVCSNVRATMSLINKIRFFKNDCLQILNSQGHKFLPLLLT